MAANEIGEKVYYSDATSKVTNVRITCEHITVPVGKIGSVDLNFRCEEFAFSILVLFSSLAPFAFFNFIPGNLKMAAAIVSLILFAASAFWVFMVYRNYVELFVMVNGRKAVILSVNMREKDYLSRIASAIGDAITDEDRFQKMKASGEIDPSSQKLSLSETMHLKSMLDDYQKLKGMKELILKPKTAACS
ncbi:MAG TPA: hypothetical protein DET40_01555 [Lentisphaeria bacterium]|nr:MAG: hypothetical protein A2X45_17165 [Lentisphaerae bacterium GWF2_50_93]HCE42219.1 hypothetical protein [Lentisphaeria bacterium]